jgi:hypothetical protein
MRVRRHRFVATGGALLLAVLTATSSVAAASSGWLDPTFGRNGTVDLRPNPSQDRIDARHALRSPRGVFVLSWARYGSPGAPEDEDQYVVHALTTSGAVDRSLQGSFSPAGQLGGGTILGEVKTMVSRSTGFAVVYNTNDLGFSKLHVDAYSWTGARQWSNAVTLSFNDFGPTHATVLPDGRIRACVTLSQAHEGDPGVWLVGLLANGDFDPSVGPNGYARRLDLGTAATCNAIEADQSGRLIVAASGRVGGRRAAIVGRFDAAGAVDPSFGTGGRTELLWSSREFVAHDLVRLGTQGWLLGGQSIDPGLPPVAFTARLTPGGLLNGAYGYGGVYRYPGGSGGSVLRSLDGVGGDTAVMGVAKLTTGAPTSEALLRIRSSTGRLDPTFGRNGAVGVPHEAIETIVDRTGRTVTVGSRVNSSTSVLVQGRYP